MEITDTKKVGDSPRKLNLRVLGKGINLPMQFDGQVGFEYVNPDKRDLMINVNLKKVPSSEKMWTVNGEVNIFYCSYLIIFLKVILF